MAINIGMGFVITGVDNAAHVGGVLGGLVLGVVMAVAPAAVSARATLVRFMAAAGLVAVCVGALLSTANRAELLQLRAELDAQAPSDR